MQDYDCNIEFVYWNNQIKIYEAKLFELYRQYFWHICSSVLKVLGIHLTHTRCANKNDPVACCYSQLLDHFFWDTLNIYEIHQPALEMLCAAVFQFSILFKVLRKYEFPSKAIYTSGRCFTHGWLLKSLYENFVNLLAESEVSKLCQDWDPTH